MLRLTLLLLAGLFATLQIAGRDTGQMRLGLIEGEKEAALRAANSATKTATKAAAEQAAEPATRAAPVAQTVEVAFTPGARVMAPVAKPAVADVRYVSGRSVNVRSGPSTRNDVVDRLVRGDAVTVVSVEDNGWARIRVEGDGVDGYMSLDYLTRTAP